MTRHDVALLVFRIAALWIAAPGLVLATSTFAQSATGSFLLDWGSIVSGGVLVAIAVAVWLAAPRLARATFGGAEDVSPFALTRQGIPPLACFVVGLIQIAAAIPEGAGWLALRAMRYSGASLMSSPLDGQLDEQAVVTGASAVARLLVGAALIVASRRRDLWSTDEVASTE